MSSPEKLYPLSEALPLLGVRTTKFYDLLKSGEINARRIGRRTVVPESEIRRFQRSLPIVGRTIPKRGEAA